MLKAINFVTIRTKSRIGVFGEIKLGFIAINYHIIMILNFNEKEEKKKKNEMIYNLTLSFTKYYGFFQ